MRIGLLSDVHANLAAEAVGQPAWQADSSARRPFGEGDGWRGDQQRRVRGDALLR